MVVEWYDENFEIDIAILKPLDPATFHEFERHLQPAPIQYSLPVPLRWTPLSRQKTSDSSLHLVRPS
jgi:hypothetical protein